MAWDAGGYFPASYLRAGTIALVTCAVLLLATRPRYALSGEALVALSSLGALALWTGLSSTWSPAPSAALDAMQRDIAYLGILGLALLAGGSGRYARQLIWLALTVVTVVCGAGLVARLLPEVLAEPQATITSFRLSYPLTYWNALGAMAAVGAVLSAGLAADPRTRWELRGLSGGVSVLLVTTMTLSLSRGAWIALFAGLAVLVLLSAHRGSLVLTAIVLAFGWVAAVGRLQAYPALTDDPSAAGGQVAAGHAYLPQLLVICALVAAAIAFIGAARASAPLMRSVERLSRPAAWGAGVLLVFVLVAGYGLAAGRVEGAAAGGLGDAGDWIDRQWDDFMAPTGEGAQGTGSARITGGAGGSRSDVYRVALDAFGDHPLAGAGAGSFRVHWLAERPISESVVNAHSLEIETLSELGLIGAALLATFLGAIAVAGVRSRRKPGALPRSQTAAVAGACTVWLVHSALDWDWQMPALTGVMLLLACTLFPVGRWRRARTRRPAVSPS